MKGMAQDKKRGEIAVVFAMELQTLLDIERLRKRLHMGRDKFLLAACKHYVETLRGAR